MAKARFSTWKKNAPKVPDITCPEIDKVLDGLDRLVGKQMDSKAFKRLEKKLEKLRKSNEQLREGGEYWYGLCKEHFKELPVLDSIQKFIKKLI